MNCLKEYAYYHKFEEYQVYYMGNSIGASVGMMNAYKYPEITKLVSFNRHLMINPNLCKSKSAL